MGQGQVRRTVVWQRESGDDSAAMLKNGAGSDLSELNYEETAAHWEPGPPAGNRRHQPLVQPAKQANLQLH